MAFHKNISEKKAICHKTVRTKFYFKEYVSPGWELDVEHKWH